MIAEGVPAEAQLTVDFSRDFAKTPHENLKSFNLIALLFLSKNLNFFSVNEIYHDLLAY